jgi:O-antigen/teichoic acid export membrane protein
MTPGWRNIRLTRISLRESWVATGGSVLTAVVGQALLIVSGILYARLLGPTNRGYLALLLLLPAVFSQLGNGGLPVAASYYIARGHTRNGILKTLLRPAAVLLAILVVVQTLALIWYVHGQSADVSSAAFITLVAVPAMFMQDIGLGILQGEQRFRLFNLLRLQSALYNALGAVLLFATHRHSLLDATVMFMAGTVIAAVVALTVAIKFHERAQMSLSPSFREMASFGLKGLLGSVSPVEVFRLDQAIVGLAISPAALGVYVVALSLTNLPRFIAGSIGMIAYPRIAREPRARQQRQAIWRFFWAAVATSGTIVVALELLAGELIPLFFGPAFGAAISVCRILLVGALFLSARRVLADGLRGAGLPIAGTVGEVASWLCLVPLLVVLGRVWQLNGIAVAFAASAALSLAVLLAFERARGRRPVLADASIPPGGTAPVQQ